MAGKWTRSFFVVLVVGLGLSSLAHAAHPRPAGWWKLDGDVLDSSGNGHHGTLQGDPQWVPGVYGQALDMAGSDYISIDGYKGILGTNAFSITAWIRTTDNGVIVGWGAARGGDDAGKFAQLRTNDTMLRFDHGGGNVTTPGVIVANDEWHHVAATVAENATIQWPSVKLYVDGEEVGDQTTDSDPFDIVSDFDVTMGIEQDRDGRQLVGTIDDVRIYDIELTQAEIQEAMAGIGPGSIGAASEPNPAEEEEEVARDVVLSWTPGKYAPAVNGHTLYFSENLDDVENGIGGIVLSASTYTPPQPLDFGKTYYWRVDEVNAPPDATVFAGAIWQFTVEPFALAIAGDKIIVTASSSNSDAEGPENTINGSGLDADDLHSIDSTAMWLSSLLDPNTAWIQYEFDKVYNLHEMLVWNHNSSAELAIGYGIREATIGYSADGVNWTTLGTTHELNQATGMAGYAANTSVDLSGVAAKFVKITPISNWRELLRQYGLSEVRFSVLPLSARRPSPDSGATDVSVNATLTWRAGREAAMHDVYLSTDEQAVIDGNVPTATVAETSFSVPPLDLSSQYYWRIDEVNEAETPTTWQGDVWDFTTQEYLVVEDFESYADDIDGGTAIFQTWIDGVENGTGSYVGYEVADDGTFAETSIVHDGRQSMPLQYDNTGAPGVSEADRTFVPAQDWSKHAIKALTLRFHGDPNNSVTDRMYVKINGSKVTYDGDAASVTRTGWQMWYIDLASMGVNLSNVTTLTIGFEPVGASGGRGIVYFDSIRLYPHDRLLITPADPGTTGLQARYEFEGTTNDSSGNARHGTAMGNPTFVEGKIGQAIGLDGLGDYVEITGYKGILDANPFSISAWIKTSLPVEQQIVYYGTHDGGQRCEFRVDDTGDVRIGNGAGQVQSQSVVADGVWHHVVVTIRENATNSSSDVRVYIDGQDDTRESTDLDPPYGIVASFDVTIGYRPSQDDRLFQGQIDDVRIYDRVLSPEEAAWLAGRTKAFDKPF